MSTLFSQFNEVNTTTWHNYYSRPVIYATCIKRTSVQGYNNFQINHFTILFSNSFIANLCCFENEIVYNQTCNCTA